MQSRAYKEDLIMEVYNKQKIRYGFIFKLIPVILLAGGVLMAEAQVNDTGPCKYINKATRFYCQKKYHRAMRTLNKFSKLYPGHVLSEEVSFARGVILQEKGRGMKAIPIFSLFITFKDSYRYDSTQAVYWYCNEYKMPCERLLMQEELVNLQHESCLRLADIYMDLKRYNEAMQWIVNADKYYRYWFGCGTGDLQESIRLATYYARIFELTGQTDVAIQTLLPQHALA